MIKVFTLGVLIAAFASCTDTEFQGEHQNIKLTEILKPLSTEDYRLWQEETYVTEEAFRIKELTGGILYLSLWS